MTMLDDVEPREQAGRDALARFRAQIRSAALASLSILEDKEIDRVYCDMHDDFVVRINSEGTFLYVFYQVKTKRKQNHNWTMKEIFGINARVKDASKHKNTDISKSFAGRLLLHTVKFGDSCKSVVFQTNINVDDPIENLVNDINSGKFENSISKVLVDRFPDCFSSPDLSEERIKENLKKLKFETDVQYLKFENDGFSPTARDAIYKYSEIDLTQDEAKDILIKLVELVESKSSGVLSDLCHQSIEKHASVSISDLLDVLSISKAAYSVLAEGGDLKAVRNASIIQRTLSEAGANDEQIEYCSRCKISWDEWFRRHRHILTELEVMTIQSDVARILHSALAQNQVDISSLKSPIENYLAGIERKNYGLDGNTILGGVMAELVRIKR